MKSKPVIRTWRLVRAGGGAPDVANVVRRAQSFAAAAVDAGHVTLLAVAVVTDDNVTTASSSSFTRL